MAKVFINIEPEEIEDKPSVFRSDDGTVMVLIRVADLNKFTNFLKVLGPRGVLVGFSSDSLDTLRISHQTIDHVQEELKFSNANIS